MQEALKLLAELTDDDVSWMLEQGTEQQVIANTHIIREGEKPTALFMVLEGLVGIEIDALDAQMIAYRGPGELLGEISFLDDQPASATVKAVENSLLLALPCALLDAKLAADTAFAARPYRACALMTARRLRERIGDAGYQAREKPQQESLIASTWERLSGPVEGMLDDPTQMHATLIDIDLQALAYVSDRSDRLKLRRQMELVNGNLVYLATGRQKINLRDQDLVYSIGLIDYFSDKFVIALLNYAHSLLRPGGKVVLGNFHTNNPDKVLMDYVLDWKLIHRTEANMNRLYQASHFGKPCTAIRFEQAGVNMFAEGIKEAWCTAM